MDWGILLLSVALLLSHCDARKRAPRENLGSDGTGAGEAEEEGERWRPNVSDRLLQLLGIRQENGTYFLPHLMYDYDGLEPYMLERTVRVHHLGHHAAYTDRYVLHVCAPQVTCVNSSWRPLLETKQLSSLS